jgi:hypothetical protein
MTYSPKERRDIYLKAAELIYSQKEDYCCDAIREVCVVYLTTYEISEHLPEFWLLHPDPLNHFFIWFNGDNSREERITALLLAAELCK